MVFLCRYEGVIQMTKQEAIDLLDNLIGMIEDNHGSDYDSAIRMAIDALEPQWIPVSERLPKDKQEILFSTKTGRVHSGRYHDDNSVNQWYSHKDRARAWNNVVIAWMPLPESYKEEEE